MAKDRDFKLKYEISAADFDRLRGLFAGAEAQSVQRSRTLKVYLDTPQAALRAHGVALCFSRRDKIRDGRVKAGDWRPDPESDARTFVKKNRLRYFLDGIFTLKTDHEEVLWHAGEDDIEVALERCVLCSGARTAIFFEAQFAAADGKADMLARFVSEILSEAGAALTHDFLVEQGYRLLETEPEAAPLPLEVKAAPVDTDLGQVFLSVVRTELARALKLRPAVDFESVSKSLETVARVRAAFAFFGGAFPGAVLEAGLRPLGEWAGALEHIRDLNRGSDLYLEPAVKRGQWEAAQGFLSRSEESQRHGYAVLAQIWPQTRVKNLFTLISDHVTAYAASSDMPEAEGLSQFLSREMPKAIENLEAGNFDRSEAAPGLLALRDNAFQLAAVASFFEPYASGKASRRLADLLEELDHFHKRIERELLIWRMQALIAEAWAQTGRIKKDEALKAQVFAAGALTGFLEAQKSAKLASAIKKGLEDLTDLKPFWTKIGRA